MLFRALILSMLLLAVGACDSELLDEGELGSAELALTIDDDSGKANRGDLKDAKDLEDCGECRSKGWVKGTVTITEIPTLSGTFDPADDGEKADAIQDFLDDLGFTGELCEGLCEEGECRATHIRSSAHDGIILKKPKDHYSLRPDHQLGQIPSANNPVTLKAKLKAKCECVE